MQKVIYDHARLPNGEDIKLYVRNMENYEKEKDFFQNHGFTLSVIEKLMPWAQLNIWEQYHLFSYAKTIPEGGTYLEIGSHLGGSLLCAYEGTKASGNSINLIGIEPSSQAFKIGLERNTECIPHLRLIPFISDDAKEQIEESSVDLIFIDGDHRHEQCKRDIENYWPKIKSGGFLLGHDYRSTFPGVQKAVNEVFAQATVALLKNGTMWLIRKPEGKDA